MLEEKQVNETGQEVDGTDYIAAIKELKEKSVDRSKYEQLRAENKRLLDSIVNGGDVDIPAKEETIDIQQLRSKLFSKDNEMNNLEYVTNVLKLRKALIEKGEEDPFVPQGKRTSATEEDRILAQKVADVFEQCVEYADGDSTVFTNELSRRTKDVFIPSKRRK